MCDNLKGKQVKVEIEGRVWEEDESKVTVLTECGACIVPYSACTVIAPEVREWDLVEAKKGEDLIRGRVMPLADGTMIDRSDDTVKVSARWGMLKSSVVWVELKKITILERADGSKP